MSRLIPAMLIGLAFAAPQAAHAYDQLPRPLAALSPTDFARQVQITDDPLEATVVISTEEGYKRGRSIKGAHADDVHLRALVDRDTGSVRWQVWHDLITIRGHKHITAVHYTAAGDLQAATPLQVDHWLDQCPPTDGVGSCNQFTRIGFELPEETVREIAAAYHEGSRQPWRLRFKDASGKDVTSGIAPAEAAGLIAALDTWRRGAAQHRSR